MFIDTWQKMRLSVSVTALVDDKPAINLELCALNRTFAKDLGTKSYA